MLNFIMFENESSNNMAKFVSTKLNSQENYAHKN